MDIHLPGMSGSQAVSRVRDTCPSVAVLMLSVYEGEEQIFESLCNGAAGYLLKKTAPTKLLEGRARREGRRLSDVAGNRPQGHPPLPRPGPGAGARHDLTPQEVRLLRLLAEGASYQAAADGLAISINTARNHVRSIYEKLHVNSKSAP